MQYLLELLPKRILAMIGGDIGDITEIRIRRDRPIKIAYRRGGRLLESNATLDDIDYILAVATQSSIYAYQDKLKEGFLPYHGGIRIGIAGEGVLDDGKLCGIKNINSLAIRLPHEVIGCAEPIAYLLDNYQSTILISPPGAGKTTLLREMARILSNKGNNVLVIDERGEIASSHDGKATLDLGRYSDIVSYVPKIEVYESAVRTMSPDIIATDEIFGAAEVNAIIDCVRSGVKVLATLHGDSVQGALSQNTYSPLRQSFKNAIILDKSPVAGSIKEVVKL